MKFNVNIKKINNSFMAHIETDDDSITVLSENLEKIYIFIDKTLKKILKTKHKEGK